MGVREGIERCWRASPSAGNQSVPEAVVRLLSGDRWLRPALGKTPHRAPRESLAEVLQHRGAPTFATAGVAGRGTSPQPGAPSTGGARTARVPGPRVPRHVIERTLGHQ
jgi:hypothetical protein